MPAKKVADSVFDAPSEAPVQPASAPHHAEAGATNQPSKREGGDYAITPSLPGASKLQVVAAPPRSLRAGPVDDPAQALAA